MGHFQLVLFIIFGFFAFADNQLRVRLTYDPLIDDISDKYQAGPYLIYDCLERHWVCVLESYYSLCHEQRKKDLDLVENDLFSCAPIGKFPNKISCFQRQLFLTTHHHGDTFCIKKRR